MTSSFLIELDNPLLRREAAMNPNILVNRGLILVRRGEYIIAENVCQEAFLILISVYVVS